MLIGNIASGAGVVTTINLTYVPEKINYIAATQLTALRVEVLGEGVIFDLDTPGLNGYGRLGLQGIPANGWQFTLADGKIMNKNVVITATNSAAAVVPLMASGESVGTGYVRNMRTRIFANTNTPLRNFFSLLLPSITTADTLTFTFEDGLTEILSMQDLQFRLAETQNTVQNGLILNQEQRIEQVQVLTTTDQFAYIIDFMQERGNT